MNILVTAALAFFFAIGLGLAAAGGICAAWRGLGRRRGVSAALAAFAVVATICAQKPGPSGPTITIDALLRDAGCYATNDVFHAAVSNAPAYAAIDFSACPVLVYARERGQTNAADWAELTPRRTFSELPADYAIANATNYNYMVYLDYVPPSPVHTNGVFELHGFVVPDDEPGNLEQLSAGFINSRAVLLPPTASDYIQNGLVAMWDGIENAGWGTHHNAAPIDLINGVPLTASGSPVITDTTFDTPRNAYYYADIPSFKTAINDKNFTLEIVLSGERGSNNGIFSIGNRGIWIYGNANYNISTVNILANSYAQGINPNYRDDGVFRMSVVGSATPKVIIGTNEFAAVYGGISAINQSTCIIGGLPGFNPTASKSFRSVRLYSRALTADEIRHNYNIDKRRFNLP